MCAILSVKNLLQEEIFSAEAHSLKELIETAVLRGSDLTLANLLGANLNGANLNGTHLEGVKR